MSRMKVILRTPRLLLREMHHGDLDFMAEMLGVSRPTVSNTASTLQQAGLISYVRGNMSVLDRPGLEAASCECYRVIKGQFDRLVGGDG